MAKQVYNGVEVIKCMKTLCEKISDYNSNLDDKIKLEASSVDPTTGAVSYDLKVTKLDVSEELNDLNDWMEKFLKDVE